MIMWIKKMVDMIRHLNELKSIIYYLNGVQMDLFQGGVVFKIVTFVVTPRVMIFLWERYPTCIVRLGSQVFIYMFFFML